MYCLSCNRRPETSKRFAAADIRIYGEVKRGSEDLRNASLRAGQLSASSRCPDKHPIESECFCQNLLWIKWRAICTLIEAPGCSNEVDLKRSEWWLNVSGRSFHRIFHVFLQKHKKNTKQPSTYAQNPYQLIRDQQPHGHIVSTHRCPWKWDLSSRKPGVPPSLISKEQLAVNRSCSYL